MSDTEKSHDPEEVAASVQLSAAIAAAVDRFAEQHVIHSRSDAIRRILETRIQDTYRASEPGTRPEDLNASNDG